jgi:hypothetical protein
MEAPLVVAFEVEATNLDSKYERRQTIRWLERLRRLSMTRNS